MKAISLLQPWASLAVMGVKRYEVRSWQTKHRGPLLIHASARMPSRRERFFFEHSEHFRDFIPDMTLLPYGAVIGTGVLTDIHETAWLVQHLETLPPNNWSREFAFDDYSAGRFAWQLEALRPLRYPLPMKGTLGLWEYNGLVE